MKLPAALHPANHFHVQCLLLQGGLCADDAATASVACAQHGRRDLYHMARTLAMSEVALEDSHSILRRAAQQSPARGGQHQPTHNPEHADAAEPGGVIVPRKHSGPGWRAIAQSLRGLSDRYPSPPRRLSEDNARGQQQQQQTSAVSPAHAMAFTLPARLVALYAPRTLLPPIAHYPYHDDVTYDAAVHHAALLTQLLSPYGFKVAMTGSMRRGCPVAPHAEYLLSLTEEATNAVEAVQELKSSDTTSVEEQTSVSDQSDGLVDAAHLTSPASPPRSSAMSRHRVTGSLHRDAFTIPITTSTVSEMNAHGADCGRNHLHISAPRSSSLTQLSQNDHEARQRRSCSRVHAFAASDVVTPQVAYRTQRAMDALTQHGYVVAGRLPLLSPTFLSSRQPLHLSVRYDTRCPSQVPPRECVDPAVLHRLQLHRLALRFCPWHAQPTRLLFLTGPPAFTAHLTLQALARGIDLNLNGAFASVAMQRVSESEQEVTSPAATVVAPAAGDAAKVSMQVGEEESRSSTESTSMVDRENVEQVLISEEADLFALAGLPVVDPLLRKAYCQVHNID